MIAHPLHPITYEPDYSITSDFPEGVGEAMVQQGMGVECQGDECPCKEGSQ